LRWYFGDGGLENYAWDSLEPGSSQVARIKGMSPWLLALAQLFKMSFKI
jgi:hypothetical protein